MLTAEQIRAGRALLRWQQATLAERADVSLETIKRLERLDGPLEQVRVGTVEAIRRAFIGAGVEFIDENGGGPGVRLRKGARDESR
jgi:transcriptional regulator with XRE-family HTH domain